MRKSNRLEDTSGKAYCIHIKGTIIFTCIKDMGTLFYMNMSFGLKNVRATYQRIEDITFTSKIGRNIEVYVDYMVIKRKMIV